MPPQVVTGSPTPTRRSLLRDESGATMVMGLFMAMLLVGGLYYMHGVARVILDRDRLQDAADASAFMAAAGSARAMNILVRINQLMEALALVGMASATTRAALFLGMIMALPECLASWECFFCECDSFLNNLSDWSDYQSRDDNIQNFVDQGMRGLHGMALVVQYGYSAATLAESIRMGREDYRPQVDWGVTIAAQPVEFLPVEDDDTDWVCDEKIRNQGFALGLFSTMMVSTDEYVMAGYALSYFTGEWFGPGAVGRAREYCEDEYFQRVNDDAWLGETPFQVFSYVHGNRSYHGTMRYRESERGVRAAAFGRDSSNMSDGVLETLNGHGLAQAEFYLEFRDDPRPFLQRTWPFTQPTVNHREQWLWYPRWRARMRRVDFRQLPLLSSIPGFGSIAGLLNPIIAH